MANATSASAASSMSDSRVVEWRKVMCGKRVRSSSTCAAGIVHASTRWWIATSTFNLLCHFSTFLLFHFALVVSRLAALLLDETDIADHHLLVDGLDHVVDGERGDRDRRQCLHFDACLRRRPHARLDCVTILQ